jgi:hypothetical protein
VCHFVFPTSKFQFDRFEIFTTSRVGKCVGMQVNYLTSKAGSKPSPNFVLSLLEAGATILGRSKKFRKTKCRKE